MRAQRGFTLVELMVALAIMAMLSALAWRGIDSMTLTQRVVRENSDELIKMQTGFSQWQADFTALRDTGFVKPVHFDGKVLRITRRDPQEPHRIVVVAWALRNAANGGQGLSWMRWQAGGSVLIQSEILKQWEEAKSWGNGNPASAAQTEHSLARVTGWNLLFLRQGDWANPQSDDSQTCAPPSCDPEAQSERVPEAIRLELDLAEGQILKGKLTIDWIRPEDAAS